MQEENHRIAHEAELQNRPIRLAHVRRIEDRERTRRPVSDVEILQARVTRVQNVGRPVDAARQPDSADSAGDSAPALSAARSHARRVSLFVSMATVLPERAASGCRSEPMTRRGRCPRVASLRAGKIYCEYDAPSPEAVREHARRAGLPVDCIVEVAREISPAMFM